MVSPLSMLLIFGRPFRKAPQRTLLHYRFHEFSRHPGRIIAAAFDPSLKGVCCLFGTCPSDGVREDKPGCYLFDSVENNQKVAPHSSDPVRSILTGSTLDRNMNTVIIGYSREAMGAQRTVSRCQVSLNISTRVNWRATELPE